MRPMAILIAIMALLLAACGYRGIKPEEQDKIGKDISAMMAQIITASEKLDISVLESYLGSSPGASFYLDGRSFGRNNFAAALKESWAPYASQKIQVMEPGTVVFTPDSAIWTAQTSALAAAKDGSQTAISRCETWLWQKEEGFWKVEHCNLSSPGK